MILPSVSVLESKSPEWVLDRGCTSISDWLLCLEVDGGGGRGGGLAIPGREQERRQESDQGIRTATTNRMQ